MIDRERRIIRVPKVALMRRFTKCIVCDKPLGDDDHIRLCPTHNDWKIEGLR